MNDIITLETIHARQDELAAMIAAFNANDPRTVNVPGYPLMVRAVDYNALSAQLAEAQKNAARYLWMRDKETSEGWDIIGRSGTPDAIDAAIDAAMEQSDG